MKKRILNFLLTVALGFVPSAVFAEVNTLPEAVDGIITLEENVTLSEKLNITETVKIDLNDKVLKLEAGDNNILADVIIENGTVEVSDVQTKGDAIFRVGNYSKAVASLTFNEVELKGENYSSAYAVIYLYDANELNINKSTLTFKNEGSTSGGVIKAQGINGKVNIIDSKLDFTDTIRGLLDGIILIKNSSVSIKGTKTGGIDNGINTTSGGSLLTIDGSKINISNCDGRGITLDKTTLNIKNASNISISDCGEGEIYAKSQGIINSDKTSYIDAVVSLRSSATGTITVYGGTYTSKIDDKFIVSGYSQKDNGDGTYTILKNMESTVEKIDPTETPEEVVVGVKEVETVEEVLLDSLNSNAEILEKVNNTSVKIGIEINELKETTVDEKVSEAIQTKIGDAKIATFFDITIAVKNSNNNDLIDTLDELTEEIELMILLPAEFKNTNKDVKRTYYVVREHNGEVETMEANLSEDGNYLVFKSDKFSTYALAYEDTKVEAITPTNPATYDGISTYITMISLSFIGLVGIALYSKKDKLFN